MLITAWLDDPIVRCVILIFLASVIRPRCLLEGATIERIRNGAQYGCLRIKTYACVDGARVRVVVDSGFGDAIEPGLAETDLPVLLDFPAPRLRSYVRETVIAEKFEAMVALGRANSRVKDLDDMWLLAQTHEFRDDKLARAIAATFIPADLDK